MAAINTAPINRLPIGFLGYVDVKAMGKNPAVVADSVAATIDMAPFYRASSRLKLSATPLAPPAGTLGTQATNLQVPVNKVWLLESVWVVSAALGAAAVVAVCPVVLGPNATTVFWSGKPGMTYNNAEGSIIASEYMAQPFVMLSGQVFGVNIQRFAGAVAALTLEAVVLEVDAG